MSNNLKGPSGFDYHFCHICKEQTEHIVNPKDEQLACAKCGAKRIATDPKSAEKIDNLVVLYCPVCRKKSKFCRSPYTADEMVCIYCGVVFVTDILKMANRGR